MMIVNSAVGIVTCMVKKIVSPKNIKIQGFVRTTFYVCIVFSGPQIDDIDKITLQ